MSALGQPNNRGGTLTHPRWSPKFAGTRILCNARAACDPGATFLHRRWSGGQRGAQIVRPSACRT